MRRAIGPAMAIGHIIWWAAFAASVYIFIVMRLEAYTALQYVCGDAAHCASISQLTDRAAADLSRYGVSAGHYAALILVFMTIANLAYLIVGVLIYRLRHKDGYGLAVSAFLIVVGTIFTSDAVLLRGYPYAVKMFEALDAAGSFYLPFLYLFPDGRFVPRWTILPGLLWAAAQTYRFIDPDTWAVLNWSPLFMSALLAATHGPLLFALLYRYRRAANAAARRHLRWFLFGVLSYVAGGLLLALQYELQNGLLQLAAQVGFFAGLLFWPFAFAAGTLEPHSSKPVSPLLHRAMFGTALSFLAALLYAAAAGALGLLFREAEPLVSLMAGGLTAVLFLPLYTAVRRGVNRLVYGDPENPYELFARLTDGMERAAARESAWHDVASGIARALRLPYAAIRIGGGPAAEYGTCGDAGTTVLPLVWNGEQVGEVTLGTTDLHAAANETLRARLDALIRQASSAAYAAVLAEELSKSRERVVAAREEERRRVGRDLHDGLGAVLAGIRLKIDAITDRGDDVDPKLRDAFARVQDDIEEAIADVRRLANSLRPAVLDEFGLLTAVRELALRYADTEAVVEVEAPSALPPLGAAGETAVYRIVQEAVTNAIRHGSATKVKITLQADDRLRVSIEDNGGGFADGEAAAPLPDAGVGIRSMKERAEELGGRFELRSQPGQGTWINVAIPIPNQAGGKPREH